MRILRITGIALLFAYAVAFAAEYTDTFSAGDTGADTCWNANWTCWGESVVSSTGFEVISGVARVTTGFTVRTAVWSGGSVGADQSIEATLVAASADGGQYLQLRRTDNANYYIAGRLNASTIRMIVRTAGTETTLDTQDVATGDGTVFRFEADGDQLSLYADDVLVIGPITDSTHTTGTVAIRTTNTADWDDVTVADLAAGSPATLSAATPSGTLATSTTATLGATTDQSTGTLYGVVDTAANISDITATQIKAGQNNASASAAASCDATISTTSPSCGVTGLTAGTAYSYAEVQNNANGDSNVVTGTFTTAAGGGSASVAAIYRHLRQMKQ